MLSRVALRRQDGQASVELVAVLPLLLLVGTLCWQAALAGHAVWMSAHAARAAAPWGATRPRPPAALYPLGWSGGCR